MLEELEARYGHFFITGEAGTGKSTLLRRFRESTAKSIVVLAPTGIAAVNVQGQTIHSFFGFKPDITPEDAKNAAARALRYRGEELYASIQTIVIDEVSMVRADLMDCIDVFLRSARQKPETPFGGVQMVFIGDLYQLSPVVTSRDQQVFEEHYPSPYFFDSQVFSKIAFTLIELTEIFRQEDPRFVALLNAVRSDSLSGELLDYLNERSDPSYGLAELDSYIFLTTTNAQAKAINQRELKRLGGRSRNFVGHVEGEFQAKDLPTDEDLELKVGAQVMLLSNDGQGRWVNGTMGKVEDFGPDEVLVKLENAAVEPIHPVKWEIFRYEYDRKRRALTSSVVGTFVQYPLKLGWAITVHKSQGKTFDRVVIDPGSGFFAPGQMYVALSRCRTLEGIILTRALSAARVRVDDRVTRFLAGVKEKTVVG